MKTVLRLIGLTPRSAAVVLALAFGVVGLLPLVSAPAHALLVIVTTHFYSDGTYIHQVGQCVLDTCTQTDICSGQKTSFAKTTSGICH